MRDRQAHLCLDVAARSHMTSRRVPRTVYLWENCSSASYVTEIVTFGTGKHSALSAYQDNGTQDEKKQVGTTLKSSGSCVCAFIPYLSDSYKIIADFLLQ